MTSTVVYPAICLIAFCSSLQEIKRMNPGIRHLPSIWALTSGVGLVVSWGGARRKKMKGVEETKYFLTSIFDLSAVRLAVACSSCRMWEMRQSSRVLGKCVLVVCIKERELEALCII